MCTKLLKTFSKYIMSYAKHSKLLFDCSDVFKYFHEPQNVKILFEKATHGLYVSSD